MNNTQAPEKALRRDDGQLAVHSIFPTIQGEGPFAGQPATFVRLAGCNLACPRCDTDYTSSRTLMSPEQILLTVKHATAPNRLVVITGGEPFRQNIAPLARCLLEEKFGVQVETNGTLAPNSDWISLYSKHAPTIVCSPKTGKVHQALTPFVDAYKYVLHRDQLGADGLPTSALDHPAHPRLARPHRGYSGPVYVQPVDEQDRALNELNTKAAIASAMKHGFTLCLQTHKIIGLA